jgi:hypothetical protein
LLILGIRPELYAKGVRKRAWKLIMMQILRRQTRRLEKSLAKWGPSEVKQFVSQFMSEIYEEDGWPRYVETYFQREGVINC